MFQSISDICWVILEGERVCELQVKNICRKMFWSDWGNSSLWMAFMDGSQPRKLTLPATFATEQILGRWRSWTEIGFSLSVYHHAINILRSTCHCQYYEFYVLIAGLSVDYTSNLLWWTTGSGTSLYSCDMNGDNMQSYTLQGVQQVYSLSAHNNLIYMHCQSTATGSGIVVLNAESAETLAQPLRMLRSSVTFNTISVLEVYQRNRPTGKFSELYFWSFFNSDFILYMNSLFYTTMRCCLVQAPMAVRSTMAAASSCVYPKVTSNESASVPMASRLLTKLTAKVISHSVNWCKV